MLAGTIPLDLDIPGSDLDILCHAPDGNSFARCLSENFGQCAEFSLHRHLIDGLPTIVARCVAEGFPLEFFGQPRPVSAQVAFRHMLAEARLLRLGGEWLRQEIRRLKRQGVKTEPAFAAVLSLPGDPWQALLDLSERADDELKTLIGRASIARQNRN